MYYKSILDAIGNTPLVKINHLNLNLSVTLLAKLEYLNPGGSVKDRIGLAMIDKAEKEGKLKSGGIIVEPTSGNTGVGLAVVAALRGYKTIFVMPDKMSDEKRSLLRAYGSKVVITPTAVLADDERSYYKVSDRLSHEIKGAYKPDQYHNPANTEAHYTGTGPEIWKETDGKITHFVCAMGTGGTITGVAKFLKEKNRNIKIIGVDPVGSVFHEYKKRGKFPKLMKTYKVEGVGEDFIPGTIDFKYIDEVIQVSDRESFLTARNLARKEGLLAGGSSGMAMYAANQVCQRLKKGLVVVLFPDSGKSYLSKIYNDDWMRENGFLESTQGITILNVLKNKVRSKIFSVNPEDSVKSTINIMKKYDISQILVITRGKLLGKVNEKELLEGLYAGRIGPTNKISVILDKKVQSVSENETIDRVSELLTLDNLVVVTDHRSKPLGVVTRIDLINYYS
ncbi:cystathionine beta-synthase [Candidatus Woesebacteria bacterium RIFCSPLOWO2_01_FULL_39_61]|nr:MAG: cystathionine beta-synthase [Candidatus Woesebacteria bacterium RIFCSPHIGHO2_01_FULL_39_95]OGM39069.1 MAG: cystathionine beta-synthase [Candidatus Woesebacteria bacterium RIFCSPHIGHO2_12_FULL_40_20]OGM68624.1 MAG: cystathionine beta-synthase [Candidatus Woesebacteria bacterium RIFCSPLOWO2_01_FULL_39_61]OGM73715.1 MAG: cystathionine beta-synthase [Candidatus Woesebacteria bacterium RIFCSPLOWO2_12_FULL_39_9]